MFILIRLLKDNNFKDVHIEFLLLYFESYNTNFKMNEPKILVAVRKRPLSKKEEGKGENDILTVKNQ